MAKKSGGLGEVNKLSDVKEERETETETEQGFINKFSTFAGNHAIKVLQKNCKTQTNWDLRFRISINNELITINSEVKVNYSSSRSNNALLIYGDILKGRSYKQCGVNAVFFPYKSKDFFEKQFACISDNDWKVFGCKYNCKYIFFFDEINNVLYYKEWNKIKTTDCIKWQNNSKEDE